MSWKVFPFECVWNVWAINTFTTCLQVTEKRIAVMSSFAVEKFQRDGPSSLAHWLQKVHSANNTRFNA